MTVRNGNMKQKNRESGSRENPGRSYTGTSQQDNMSSSKNWKKAAWVVGIFLMFEIPIAAYFLWVCFK